MHRIFRQLLPAVRSTFNSLGLAVLLALLCGWFVPAAEAQNQNIEQRADLVIYAGEALLLAGQSTIRNVAIYVANGRVLSIEWPVLAPNAVSSDQQGIQVIDLSCCFLTPGLIDTQTHLESQKGLPSATVRMTRWSEADFALQAAAHAQNTLKAGFTSIRDMGSHGRAMFAVRDAINLGKIPGPRMQVAGAVIQPGGGELRSWFRPEIEALFSTSATCNGADDCRRAVREQVALGSDTIKVATKMDLLEGSPSQLTLEELTAIAEESRQLGVRVTASAFSADSINLPLRAGFDAVVHGVFADDQTLELLRSSGAYFIPTLVAARTVKEMAKDPNTPFSQEWRDENLAIYHGMVVSFLRVHKAGLKIAFGTDAGWRPHGGNAEQLVQMVDLGMPPMSVIAAATLHAADAMGWEKDVGSLEIGKFADGVAVAGNPLEDISEFTRPVMVIKGGEIVFRRD